ncbi:MAG: cysteine dioxygenase family protein [Phycisphaerae bacterium]|nr:cysteine dioxygenase family protein [Phycisphaerae bacterium]
MPAITAETTGVAASARFPKLASLIGYLDSLTGRADLGVLSGLLSRTQVTRADVEVACKFGDSSYRRNTIARSEWYELLALCWRSGHVTPIHDHAGVSCAFRVVEGQGTEIRFRMTESGLVCPVGAVAMPPGYVCAAADADIHQVANMQPPGTDLVTMHIYSPPITKMRTYKFAESVGAEGCDAYAREC